MHLNARLTSGRTAIDVTVSAATDVGKVRRVNEDAYLAAPPVFVVADGMGGHNAGDRASVAVRDAFAGRIGPGQPATTDTVLDAIVAANVIARTIGAELAGAGTDVAIAGSTVAGVALVHTSAGLRWMVFNVGDSRVYTWDTGRLRQVSVDHSVVQELVDRGTLSAEAAAVHPDRNIITRAIGAASTVETDVWLLPISSRSAFLICSDGLTRELDDAKIARILALGDEKLLTATAANTLVSTAVSMGGRDNVTALVVDYLVVTSDVPSIEPFDSRPLEDTRPRR